MLIFNRWGEKVFEKLFLCTTLLKRGWRTTDFFRRTTGCRVSSYMSHTRGEAGCLVAGTGPDLHGKGDHHEDHHTQRQEPSRRGNVQSANSCGMLMCKDSPTRSVRGFPRPAERWMHARQPGRTPNISRARIWVGIRPEDGPPQNRSDEEHADDGRHQHIFQSVCWSLLVVLRVVAAGGRVLRRRNQHGRRLQCCDRT